MGKAALQRLYRADHVKALTRTGWARDHADTARAQAEALEDLEADADFLFRFGRERDAQGIADAGPEQVADADRGLDSAADQPASLGYAKVQRAIDRFGKSHVGSDREEYVRGLHRHFVFVKIVVLQQLDMIERAFDEGLGAGLAVLFQQVLLEAAGVDADTDRAAIGLGGPDHFRHAVVAADVSGIDAQAGSASIGSFKRALVVKVDIRNDRDAGGFGDLAQRRGAFDVRARDADDVGTGILAAADLVDRGYGIRRQGVGHCLHGDRSVPANGNTADHDLAALATRDIAPGTDRGHGPSIGTKEPVRKASKPARQT